MLCTFLVSIQFSAYPSKFAELLKHTVRLGVAWGSTGYYDYDTQYRIREALSPTSLLAREGGLTHSWDFYLFMTVCDYS